MRASDIPRSIVTPWASAAGSSYVRSVPNTGSSGGSAAYDVGFPPQTFQSIASGGTPPDGRDMNGALLDVTGWARWVKAGATVHYDAAFASAVGGYPAGCVLASTTLGRLWQSTADNNATDPDSSSAANWVAVSVSFGTITNSITYPDGTIDQWGSVQSSSTGQPTVAVALATNYTTGSYNISVSPFINGASTTMDSWIQVIRNTIGATGFSVQYQASGGGSFPGLDGFYWRTIGK